MDSSLRRRCGASKFRTVALQGAFLTGALLLGACASSGANGSSDEDVEYSRWVPASPVLQQQIDDEVARLPWTHGFERLEQIRWFAAIGEPAYASLLELCGDDRPDVAAAALAALGATLDRRLVPYIHGCDWSEASLDGDLGLERARTLLRLGDWSEVPRLIAGMRHERVYTRTLCFDALTDQTSETHGYDPRSEPSERERAVVRWEEWWNARGNDGMLAARP